MTCEPCDHAAKHAFWGPSLAPFRSHCPGCHRSWSSRREGHCVSCHAQFSTGEVGDYHAVGGVCTPPEEVLRRDGKPRYTTKDTPGGKVFKLAYYGDRPDFASFGTEDEDEDDED